MLFQSFVVFEPVQTDRFNNVVWFQASLWEMWLPSRSAALSAIATSSRVGTPSSTSSVSHCPLRQFFCAKVSPEPSSDHGLEVIV